MQYASHLYCSTPPIDIAVLLGNLGGCSGTDMTGRPGYRTMEMIGGTSAPYLACTPCIPLLVHCLIGVETEGLLDYQGRAGIISIVRWNLRPVIFGVELWSPGMFTIISGDFFFP